jgi:uncharacterized membrane protein
VCLQAGWGLIKDQYWLFLGMALVGILLGSAVPLAILMGPMMCGIYLALFQRRRGETVEFGTLFRGFDYFGDSIIATLFHTIPIIIVMVPFYIVFYGGMFFITPDRRHGGDPGAGALLGFFGVMVVMGLVMAVLILLLAVVFAFAYPLIVERKLSGIEAVKLSMKAGLGNFWPLLGLLLLNGLLSFAGTLLCFVGVYLALPVTFAAIAMAYEQVFDLGQAPTPLTPPPPPTF